MYKVKDNKNRWNRTPHRHTHTHTQKTIDKWKIKVLDSEKMNTEVKIPMRYEKMEPRSQSRQLPDEKSLQGNSREGVFPWPKKKKATYILAH